MSWEMHQMNVQMTFLECTIGDETLYETTRRICIRGERTSCVQTQENIIWVQAITKDVTRSSSMRFF